MKVLIAAACVAIIAFVGFFFWDRYAAAQAEADRQARAYCRSIFEDADRMIALNDPSAGRRSHAVVMRDFDRCRENPLLQPGE